MNVLASCQRGYWGCIAGIFPPYHPPLGITAAEYREGLQRHAVRKTLALTCSAIMGVPLWTPSLQQLPTADASTWHHRLPHWKAEPLWNSKGECTLEYYARLGVELDFLSVCLRSLRVPYPHTVVRE